MEWTKLYKNMDIFTSVDFSTGAKRNVHCEKKGCFV